ncbi:MAG: amino acid ABC transporter permease [Nakamurella sp.]
MSTATTGTTGSTEEVPPQKKMTRKQRALLIRSLQVAALVAVVVVLAIVGDWGAFTKSFFNTDTISKTIGRMFTSGLRSTIIYTLSAFAVGLSLGLIIALMRLSDVALYRWIGTAYVELFRGLPALLVLFLVTFGFPLVFPEIKFLQNFFVKVAIGLGSVAAAYIAETIRAGIQAVPKGQMEAARTLGMSNGTAMRKIILPQAFRVIIPPLTNEIILLVKDSSLVYALGVTASQYELTKLGQSFATGAIPGIPAGPTSLALAGMFYLVITLPLSQAVRQLELKQQKRR